MIDDRDKRAKELMHTLGHALAATLVICVITILIAITVVFIIKLF